MNSLKEELKRKGYQIKVSKEDDSFTISKIQENPYKGQKNMKIKLSAGQGDEILRRMNNGEVPHIDEEEREIIANYERELDERFK